MTQEYTVTLVRKVRVNAQDKVDATDKACKEVEEEVNEQGLHGFATETELEG